MLKKIIKKCGEWQEKAILRIVGRPETDPRTQEILAAIKSAQEKD